MIVILMMKKLSATTVIFLVVLSFVFVKNISGNKTKPLITPLIAGEQVLGINQWLPDLPTASNSAGPEISAESAFFIDTKTGQILYAKNPHSRLPIASLVKVMTVLVALEHRKMDDTFTVSQHDAEMEPDKMQLIAGEKLTLKELLYGIFLVSANDAAETLAKGTLRLPFDKLRVAQGKPDSRTEFIKLMNDKAKQLGMKDTFYANPTGLDEDSNNSYSSAYDLALLTRYLIRNFPETVDISQTVHIILPVTPTHQDYDLYSGINLLTTYPGVVGFKTGYTPEAGLTLITLARKNNHEIIGIILGSGDRRDEARELLDYSFGKL